MDATKLHKLLYLCLAFFSVCYALRLKDYNADCNGKATGGTVNSIDVTGCVRERCEVHPDITYGVRVNFTAHRTITVARNLLTGIFGPLQLKMYNAVHPLNNCGNSLNCPIQPGQTVAYSLSLSFSAKDVPLTVQISSRWELQDANNTDILCFVIPLVVHDS